MTAIIQTDSFTLRQFTKEDTKAYFESVTSKEAKNGFMSCPKDMVAAQKEVDHFISQYDLNKPEEECFVIEVNSLYAGSVSVHGMHKEHFEHRADLSYAKHPQFYKKSYSMADVVAKMIDYIFAKYPYIVRIEGWCRDFNQVSANVMRRAGMVHEGTLHKNKCRDGQFLNDMIFAIVR